MPYKIAVFASGAGSNAKRLMEYFWDKPHIKIEMIVCNNPNAGVLKHANRYKMPVLMINKARFQEDGYVNELKQREIDIVVLAGFLWKVPEVLIGAFPQKIINLHPSLLPKYGGKGMYGDYVHQAVLNNNEKESGITIHLVDEHYDNGEILFQATCPIDAEDTSYSLAQKIHGLEHAHFPKVIENYIENC